MSKQDHTHSSVVSTLLALMDGLDNRGQVIVIGATNRVDAIDPALRRPGRFDREFYFPLPDQIARRKILEVNTQGWEPALSDSIKDFIASVTDGYCGADVKALCSETALYSVRRKYPQIYSNNEKLVIDTNKLAVTESDFMEVLKSILA
jgi:SpoVK/Ycf46/Vps4 family AAA+-type ATPase